MGYGHAVVWDSGGVQHRSSSSALLLSRVQFDTAFSVHGAEVLQGCNLQAEGKGLFSDLISCPAESVASAGIDENKQHSRRQP